MVREYYEKICAGDQVRANLILLKDALKEENSRRAFAYFLGGSFTKLCELLKDEDPKVRKNAALILGKMDSEDLLLILFDAYQKEQTKFIRADYLKAMEHMDCTPVLEQLEKQLEQLLQLKVEKEEQKHISEEIRVLQKLILKNQSGRRHKFVGDQAVTDVILVTNRCQREATAQQIKTGKITMLAGGLRVRENRIKEILPIRTYSELLFPLENEVLPVQDPEYVGTQVAKTLLERVEKLHEGDGPYLFRIELKSKLEAGKKGNYIRKVSDALERASAGRLVNSVDDYEIELRLLEKKDDTFAAMLKLYTIEDKRFSYRKEYVAASIAPVNAALAVQLAKTYLKENAQVLDPFCGVGTMLIERNKAVRAGIMYGVDIFGDAIEKAHINTERSGCHVYYIKKDFFAFEHEYLFDEVITDMPQTTAAKPKQEIHALYQEFFQKIRKHLKENAILILYATEPQFVKEAVKGIKGYRIEKQFVLNEKNGTSVFVVEWKK